MRRLGIKYQILLITLIPVLLIDLFFTYNHIDTSISQANEILRTKGNIIARQIAGASEFNLFSGNHAQIDYLLEQSIDANDIVHASVYDHEGILIARADAAGFRNDQIIDYLYLRQPILSQSIEHADIFSPDSGGQAEISTLGWVHLYLSRQQLARTTHQIVRDSIVFFFTVLLMAVVLTSVIGRRITEPIFRLVEHLKDVETGQLGNTIEPVEANEIGALQKGFNRMTRALLANRRHLNQRIQQATQQLNEAITALESKNRELGFARDEAQNANRTKSEFLANMSHEIRTPINGIKGFISLLSQSKLDQNQQRYVDIIMKSTADLTNIVNEILDFSKMESGKLQIVDETFDLHEVLEQTRDLLFINVLTKNIDLNLIIFSDTPRRVVGDKLRLKQILLNLIGNAIKFTDRGRVVIKVCLAEQQDDDVEIDISIRDTGIGISAEDQKNLFQAFSQVDSSDTRRIAGTGLGLVISKNLAQLMGGDITLESSPGEGSTFYLRIPFKCKDDDTVDDPQSGIMARALILGADETCLMETRTLFDRAGVNTETGLIDNAAGVEPLRETIQRNLAYIELLVFDMRHLEIDLEQVLNPDIASETRVIVMHYAEDLELGKKLTFTQFASVISTQASIAELVGEPVPRESAGEALTARRAVRPKSVLLVDDNQVNLHLASELIRLWGHEVVEADHGDRAMALYREQRFDFVILDIQMPDIDGVSLLKMMRELRPDDPAPMVALSANILNDEAERLLELGFDYFLSKPIDEASFRSLLDGDPQRRGPAATADGTAELEQDCSVDYQRSLALAAGNEALLRQIFEILQRDIPDQRQQLTNALQALDLDRLGAIAHKLNGVTCYASLPRLRHKVLAFQQRLARDSHPPLANMVDKLLQELAAVEVEVERHLASMNADKTPP